MNSQEDKLVEFKSDAVLSVILSFWVRFRILFAILNPFQRKLVIDFNNINVSIRQPDGKIDDEPSLIE
jgi:hypothetical protein